MNKFTTIAASVALALSISVAGFGTQVAHANPFASHACLVKTGADNTFAVKNGTVTATFTVVGMDCNQPVTLASWQAPNGDKGQPYNLQKLFAHTTGTFGVGKHSLSVALPNCFYQVDLVTGSAPTDATGGPGYAKEGRLRRSLHGGTQSCVTTPPVTPPVTPPTTTVTETPAADVEELPHTGANAGAMIVTVLGSIVVATLGYRRFLSRQTV